MEATRRGSAWCSVRSSRCPHLWVMLLRRGKKTGQVRRLILSYRWGGGGWRPGGLGRPDKKTGGTRGRGNQGARPWAGKRGQSTMRPAKLLQRSIRSGSARARCTTPTSKRVATIDPLNWRTSTVYDNAKRPIASINPLNEQTATVCNQAGLVIATIDPLNRRTSTVFDARTTDRSRGSTPSSSGRPLSTTRTAESSQPWIPSASGRAASTTPTDESWRRNRSARVPDEYGLRPQRPGDRDRGPLGRRTSSVYDPRGRVVAKIDAMNRRTSIIYSRTSKVLANLDQLGRRPPTSTTTTAGLSRSLTR